MIFIDNKYTKWYYQIIESARINPPTTEIEHHHIIPKCVGGTNDTINIIPLSPRQHFICHLLLVKMVSGTPKKSLSYALWRMTTLAEKRNHSRTANVRISSHLYNFSRKKFLKTFDEKIHCNVCGNSYSQNVYVRCHGEKCGKVVVPLANKQYIKCEVCMQTVDDGNYAQYHGVKCGLPQSRPKKTCEKCSMVVSFTNYTRWHGIKCRARVVFNRGKDHKGM